MIKIQKLSDIPEEDLNQITSDLRSEGVASATVEKQKNGLWTVIVEITDDEDDKKQRRRAQLSSRG